MGWSGVSNLAHIAAGAILCGRNFDPCSDMQTRQLEAREKSRQKLISGERKMMFGKRKMCYRCVASLST